ncbi:MBL fold metallo-hydrolase [Burkholderia gladioli]|uniref:MBL fold metallo-hydrolase n=1 Tax=Burkholderia gladioli TaxID=28095 RepID=UPI00163F812F|nr:MBL fold metallo-hydrolase [Burkholderia gladioli]MDN7805802.1 MBL fold metallo-hydrolase [Burkholderia gladioli]
MRDKHQIIFYPVGNGDTTQIILSSGKRVLFDFCHRDKAEDPKTPEIDLKARLKEDLKAADRDYFDVVAFTHADLDHIQGSTDFFELQHAKKYHGEGRIKIRELWVPAAMLLEEADKDHQKDEFVLLRQEARYRLLEGKDIRVFSQPQALMDWLEPLLEARGEAATARDHLFVDAGTLVPGFELAEDLVEFFCHSPFIKHCDEGDVIRNSAALVFNVRLRANGQDYDYLEVGDAKWQDIEEIVSITQYHKNEDRLAWDLYNIPHHCSYLALSDEKGKRETEPKELVKALLMMGKQDAYIVSCSLPVPDVRDSYDRTQPPHIQARKTYERYLEEVGGRKFLVTMEEPNANKPEPIVFDVTSGGISLSRTASIGAPAVIISTPPRAG